MSGKQAIRGKNKFQLIWLQNKDYKNWLERLDEYNGRCKLCLKDIKVSNMGESALKSHMASTKHDEMLKQKEDADKNLSLLHYLPRISNSTKSADGASSSKLSPPSLQDIAIPVAVLSAEIRWALKVVTSHFSLRSCLELNELLKAMFSDSEIAKSFHMSKTKLAYIIVFGIAPYFKTRLVKKVKSSPFYTVLFDESLNEVFQEEQMDVQIRFWDEETSSVTTRYFDSQFLSRPNALNLVNAINAAVIDLDKSKMIHLSMDGPNTNWAVFKEIQKKRKQEEKSPLLNLQSCGLHNVSGALQTGFSSTNWELEKVLQG